MRRAANVLFLVAAVVLAGCGSSGPVTGDQSRATSSTVRPQASTSSVPMAITTTTTTMTTTTIPITTTTTTPVPSTTSTLAPGPGDDPEPVPGPIPGSTWAVVGVAHDDVLNVRAGPGVTAMRVGALEPTASGIEATGTAFIIGSTIWWEVRAGTTVGFVSSRYVAATGATSDVTAAVIDAHGGVRPSAESMAEIASAVLEARPHDEAVVVVASSVQDSIGEIVLDTSVRGDDSVRGERLHVFGQRDGEGSSFSLYAVESTTLCWRGSDAAGLCV